MANSFSDLHTVLETPSNMKFSQTYDVAWTRDQCGVCGGSTMAVLAYSERGITRWLRCVSCFSALVDNEGVISPSQKPLSIPAGIPPIELAAWKEVRECLGVGAYTAAVMMCRKLLFHVAVSQGLPEKKDGGRAPNFTEAIDQLEATGLVTKKMLPWVERIKKYGNDANHEITPMTIAEAKDVSLFTEQLLKLAYEMDALIADAGPVPSADKQV